jgi:heme-degrading monooxygenase HmoA
MMDLPRLPRTLLTSLLLLGAACVANTTPAAAQATSASAGLIAVVVEVALVPGATEPQALVAIQAMRNLQRRQPGYVSETFFQNISGSHAPRYLHLSRWVSLNDWAAVFRAPEFNALSAHGNEHYSISVNAFVDAP